MLSLDGKNELISKTLWLKFAKTNNTVTLVKNIYFLLASEASIFNFGLHEMFPL
jgi:hypothetical protein